MTRIRNLASDEEAFTCNAYLVEAEQPDGTHVVVDPGDAFDIVAKLEGVGVSPERVVLTHTHPDHVGNVDAVRDRYGCEVWGFDATHAAVDRALADRETVALGDAEFRVLHTPGHKDDHVILYSAGLGTLFAGDLVFADGAFGRTDLAEGDRPALIESIDRLRELVGPEFTAMHTGHGPSVTESPADHLALSARAARTH